MLGTPALAGVLVRFALMSPLRCGRSGYAGPRSATLRDSPRRPADAMTTAALAQHLDEMQTRACQCGTAVGADGFVFSHSPDASTPWFPGSVSRSFKRLCAREGIDDVRLHDLRHFVATQLLSAGVDVRTVAGRLGHRNAATTLNVYAHFLQQSDRVAADVIGDIITNSRALHAAQPNR
jgi:integrase